MERKIDLFLNKWKSDIIRKPLVVYGSKQVGKTFTILKFGKENYKNIAYFNTENNQELLDLFYKEKNTTRLIEELSNKLQEKIFKDDTLIIFDNISNAEILKTIKLFGSEKNKYHIIGISSRRDVINEMIVEEIQFKSMNEMDFEEYLWAQNEKNLANIIRKSFVNRKTCRFHKIAQGFFEDYLITGGYPEVILAKKQGMSEYEIDAVKQKIIDIVKSQIGINESVGESDRGIEVFDSMPSQLKKQNKKFQYGVIGQGRRAKEFENIINNLVNNQILYRSYKVKDIKSPLSSNKDSDSFKLYVPDNGLLITMMHLTKKEIQSNEYIKETIYENHITKSLVENNYIPYYYQTDGKAELNFVFQNRMGKIIPIEITTRSNSKSKALSVFMKKFVVTQGYRITENNFSTKKDIRYLPIYSMFCLDELNK